jgi:hypothetical protein
MKKTSITIGVVAVIGIAVGGLQSVDSQGVPPIYRLAFFDQQCPAKGENGFNYLKNNCIFTKTLHNEYCACATGQQEPLISEMDPTTLPDIKLRKFAICRDGDGRFRVGWWAVQATPPPTWTCEVIVQKTLFWRSMGNVEYRLYKKLKEKCCVECDECFVFPDKWGMCPYCLLDDNCKDYCL